MEVVPLRTLCRPVSVTHAGLDSSPDCTCPVTVTQSVCDNFEMTVWQCQNS